MEICSSASRGNDISAAQMGQPQLTRLVDKAPTGDGWLHEIKYDGHRMHEGLCPLAIILASRSRPSGVRRAFLWMSIRLSQGSLTSRHISFLGPSRMDNLLKAHIKSSQRAAARSAAVVASATAWVSRPP